MSKLPISIEEYNKICNIVYPLVTFINEIYLNNQELIRSCVLINFFGAALLKKITGFDVKICAGDVSYYLHGNVLNLHHDLKNIENIGIGHCFCIVKNNGSIFYIDFTSFLFNKILKTEFPKKTLMKEVVEENGQWVILNNQKNIFNMNFSINENMTNVVLNQIQSDAFLYDKFLSIGFDWFQNPVKNYYLTNEKITKILYFGNFNVNRKW